MSFPHAAFQERASQGVWFNRTGYSRPDLFFKAGQERFKEGVGDQIDHGLPGAGLGVLQGA